MDSLWVNIPAVAAVMALTKMMLDHFAKENDKNRADRAQDRMTWENHLSQSILVQRETVGILTRLVEKVDRWS